MVTKVLLSRSDLTNPLKLSSTLIQAVIRELGQLEEIDREMAVNCIRYAIDGTNADVLLKLAGEKESDVALITSSLGWQASVDYGKRQAAYQKRAKILRPGVAVPAEFYLRLAEIYEAASQRPKQPIHGPKGWPKWLTVFVFELVQCWNADNREGKKRPKWTLRELDQILEKAELSSELFIRVALNASEARNIQLGGSYYYNFDLTDPFTGWTEHLKKHLDQIKSLLVASNASQQVEMFNMLHKLKFDFKPILEEVVKVGVVTAKSTREAALPILLKYKKEARPLIENELEKGSAGNRNEAAILLWRLYEKDCVELLQAHKEKDSSDRVKQTIDKLLAVPIDEAAAAQVDLELPPVVVETGKIPLPAEAKKGLEDHFERAYEKAEQNYKRELDRYENTKPRPTWMRKPTKPQRVKPEVLKNLIAFVEGKKGWTVNRQDTLHQYAWLGGNLGDWLAPPDVKLIHVVRLAYALDHLQLDRGRDADSIWWHRTNDLEAYRSRCEQPFGLRELAAAIVDLPNGKNKEKALGICWLTYRTWYSFADWEDDAIWPYFAEHLDLVEKYMGPCPNVRGDYANYDYGWNDKRRTVFRVLGMFPQLPPKFVPLLWEIALGEAKTDRPLAQEALRTIPNKTPKVIVALGDGKQGVRAAAAEWLGKLGDAEAIEPLKTAFRKEKQELVKGIMMTALEQLGADVNEFMDRDKLAEEAKKGLQKKLPRGMDWVPMETLPKLHWQDNGKEVDPQIVQWWIVQSIQQKSPACGPLVRRFLQMCKESEAKAFARFILQAWIGHDTRAMPQEEAAAQAKKDADTQWSYYSKHDWWKQTYPTKDVLYRQLLNQYTSQCVGSAIGEKGMLALVSAAGDRECVRMAERYIRKWGGQRMSQSKALLEVLAWVDHPLSIQVLLSIATRFKTKGLRKAAEDYVQAMAEREGWTLDELADRTIPDGGFARPTDEQGKPIGNEATLLLDYGGRELTVTLNDELVPVVTTSEGKVLKSPPSAAKDDDEEKVKEAKKLYSEAKKTVKEVLKQQTLRMYEALCTQRAWKMDEWQRYLADHPIMGRVCNKLIWCAFKPGKEETFRGCFRPLEDGSFTNEADDEVSFPPETLVRLAHTCNVPEETGEAWLQHLKDYDITPPFEQFGRETYVLDDKKKNETELKDFEGHMVRTFQIRSKATKLGYIRGDIEDGGSFYCYRKPFPTLGIQAIIEFTGSYVPEEDMSAALTNLNFTRIKKDDEGTSWDAVQIPLGKVPPVLLSECYNDIKQIAATGTGFDPKWQDKCWTY